MCIPSSSFSFLFFKCLGHKLGPSFVLRSRLLLNFPRCNISSPIVRVVEMTKKVMVALDDSTESFYALEWALQHVISTPLNAKSDDIGKLSDTVILIYAQEQEKFNAVSPGGFQGQEILRIHQDNISEDVLTRSKEICSEHGVMNVGVMLVLGDARDVLCEAVLKLEPDLLVMGSHGHGAVKRAFLGSVSTHCMHHAQTAVLVAKKKHVEDQNGVVQGSIMNQYRF